MQTEPISIITNEKKDQALGGFFIPQVSLGLKIVHSVEERPKQTNKEIITSKTAQISNYFSEKSPSQDFIMGTLDATLQTAYHSIAL